MDDTLKVTSDFPTAITGKPLEDHLLIMHKALFSKVCDYIKPGVVYEICLGIVTAVPDGPYITRYTLPLKIQEQ